MHVERIHVSPAHAALSESRPLIPHHVCHGRSLGSAGERARHRLRRNRATAPGGRLRVNGSCNARTRPHCDAALWDRNGVQLALSAILRLIKGRSARSINLALRRTGAVWQQESHDYQIRTEESLLAKCDYVAQNPVRRGLCATADEWPWLFRWWINGRAKARPT